MMTKDKALEELFLAHKPQYDDEIDFMAALNKRLDAVTKKPPSVATK